MKLNFIDSHAHLNDSAFDKDRDEVIQKSFSLGVNQIIEIACEVPEWQLAVDICKKYPNQFYATAGIHPIEAATLTDENFDKLIEYLSFDNFRAVGEIGLDYFFEEDSPRKLQNEVFERQLELAEKIQKPIVLHCRQSKLADDYSVYEDMFCALKRYNLSGGVLHCFSGREKDAYRALDLGYYIGINGIIGYKRNDEVREIIKKIGLKYLLLETDCPYLPPQSKRGTRNDSSNIPEIAQTLADILGVSLEEVANITTSNSKSFYNI